MDPPAHETGAVTCALANSFLWRADYGHDCDPPPLHGDLDARVFERWLPSSETPELLRDRILWAPRGQEPLAIELEKWFAQVDRKVSMLPPRLR